MAKVIISHVRPDGDNLTALWLARRFGGHELSGIELLPAAQVAGSPQFQEAALVLDCGGVYDPAAGRFDHHQDEALPCAAKLYYDSILLPHESRIQAAGPDQQPYQYMPIQQLNEYRDLEKLRGWIEVVDACDRGIRSDLALWSRREGPHAVLSVLKAERAADGMLIQVWFVMMDRMLEAMVSGANLATIAGDREWEILNTGDAAWYATWPYADVLKRGAALRARAQHALDSPAYSSADGKVIALAKADPYASSAAYESGVRLVIFYNGIPRGPGEPPQIVVGCARSSEWQEPHIGQLLEVVEAGAAGLIGNNTDRGQEAEAAALLEELAGWYRHPAGFMAGITEKGSVRTAPLRVPLERIAAAIDAAWRR